MANNKNSEVEQSIWTVKINSQTLYKKLVDGRTILLGMTSEENEKVKEIMDKAIDDLSEALKKRTTTHDAPATKEQITTVDSTKHELETSDDDNSQDEEINNENDEEKEEDNDETDQDDEETQLSQSRVDRGSDGKFVSKKEMEDEEPKKKSKLHIW